MSAFLTALPHIHDCGWITLLHPLHINDVAYIQQYCRTCELTADLRDHITLGVRQKIASRIRCIILILACRTSYHNDCDIVVCSRICNDTVLKRHLLLRPGHTSPAFSDIIRMLLRPVLVDLQKLLIDRNVFLFF